MFFFKLLIFEENPPRGHNKRIIKFSSIKTTKINVFSFQMSKIKLNLIAFHIYLLHFNNTTKKCDSKMLVKLSICRESRTKMSQLESLIFKPSLLCCVGLINAPRMRVCRCVCLILILHVNMIIYSSFNVCARCDIYFTAQIMKRQ